MASGANPSLAATPERGKLTEVRDGLLRLHKVLLDWERIRYERTNGRIDDLMQLLHLTINDPSFAWLRGLSTLVVEMDERMEDKKKPLAPDDVTALRDEARALLTPSQTGNDFQRNYYYALQETPDIVVAHAAMLKLLKG
jgi:hypothetical protein